MQNTYFYIDIHPLMIGNKIKKVIKIYDFYDGQIKERDFEVSIILDKNILDKELIYPKKGYNLEKDLVIKFNVLT